MPTEHQCESNYLILQLRASSSFTMHISYDYEVKHSRLLHAHAASLPGHSMTTHHPHSNQHTIDDHLCIFCLQHVF